MFETENLTSLRWNRQLQCTEVIDQTVLPYQERWLKLYTLGDYCHAISHMQVRGAPLIGVTAAFGLAHTLIHEPGDKSLEQACQALLATRPTAVNLRWALDEMMQTLQALPVNARADAALAKAQALRSQDVSSCAKIAEHGLALLQGLKVNGRLNVLTHCNAGWLAALQWGTALAPIYKAQQAGLDVHVWVSETRPRNQGLNLTAWELNRAGVPYTVVADNACGLLMQTGEVDCVIVGSDRTAANGDVCNKVGTYLKALAAKAHRVPFYVALPRSTIDFSCLSGEHIPIELRSGQEITCVSGSGVNGQLQSITQGVNNCATHNPAFDVTPAEYVCRYITEHGAFSSAELAGLAVV